MKLVLFFTLLVFSAVSAMADEFSCPAGFSVESGEVPHPWFDDVFIPSKWCVDGAGIKNGPWWGWDPDTKAIVFQVLNAEGVPNGIYRMYYTNGALAEEGKMERGTRKGKWVIYKSDGTVESEREY